MIILCRAESEINVAPRHCNNGFAITNSRRDFLLVYNRIVSASADYHISSTDQMGGLVLAD